MAVPQSVFFWFEIIFHLFCVTEKSCNFKYCTKYDFVELVLLLGYFTQWIWGYPLTSEDFDPKVGWFPGGPGA